MLPAFSPALVVVGLAAVGFLVGIRLMQSPRTALWGNRLGAFSMAGALLFALLEVGVSLPAGILLLVGGGIGIVLGQKVTMIRMPQMVALFNGFGGAASALVALTAMGVASGDAGLASLLTAAVALAVGVLTFTGSIVAGLKLQAWLPQRQVVLRGHRALLSAVLVAGAGLIVLLVLPPRRPELVLQLAIVGVFALYGVLMALRVGGADMPVVISLLNSLSGIAAGVSGVAVANALLAGVGALVGVAGMILTQIMCRAMNRSLVSVLGGLREVGGGGGGGARPTPSARKHGARSRDDPEEAAVALLRQARTVVIVPGYGMALAQAQQTVRNLATALERDGKDVRFGIHPVAGRMPGHMNVLLAEAGVGFEKLYDMQRINPELPETDVVVAVGACDVINPAASTAEGTPIYGMPVINASHAKAVIVCNLDERPGYSGVDNTLYGERHVETLWGDAADTVAGITRGYQRGRTVSEPGDELRERAVSAIRGARSVVVVPGYGLALAQAQEALKSLIDALEEAGKRVGVAIHPRAGGILGHMAFLLQSAGIEHDRLVSLEQANAELAGIDLALVVGACDVANRAAWGEPDVRAAASGMVALRVEEASSVVVCNLDAAPGYSGVDNPLYREPNVIPVWGDAARTLPLLLERCAERVANDVP